MSVRPNGQARDPQPSKGIPPASLGTIGSYVLRKKLGEGAVGEVFLAHDRILDREVALKLLRPGIAASEASLREFVREARAAAKLSHPNVATIFQVDRKGGKVFIAMEYVAGGSLADEVKTRGALPWRDATLAIRDAASGMVAAHEAGIVHRDIKPGNLMRTGRGLVKVVDFGLAKARDGNTDVTQTQAGTVLGSPAYMPPEQCRGEPADARSDLYSLICSYYQLLTRQLPFAADQATVAMYRHCHEPFPDARATGLMIPDGVIRILEKGSRKGREERYQTAAELVADLEVVLHAPEASTISGTGYPPGQPQKETGPGPGFAGSILRGKGMMGKTTWALVALTLAWLALIAMRMHPPRGNPPTGTLDPSPLGIDALPQFMVSAAGLAPIPSQSDQYKAEQKIRSILREDYARHEAADRQALAVKLVVQGQADADPVMRFVLFREARDLAALAGNTTIAFQAVDETAKAYTVDAVELKTTAFVTASIHATSPDDILALVDGGLDLLDLAAATDHYADAARIGPLLESAAGKTKDIPLVSKVQLLNKKVADLRREFDKQKAAFDALRKDPADPGANLAVGRYMCFRKSNWDTGLPMLAKGSDANLKGLASKELANPADPATRLRLADGWWDQIARQGSADRVALEGHAAAWYQKAFPNLSSADRARAESRLPRDMIPATEPTAVAGSTSPGKTTGPAAANDPMAAKAEGHLVRSYAGPEPYNAKDLADGNFTYVYLTPNGRNVVRLGPGVTVWERSSGKEVFRAPHRSVLSPDQRYIAWGDGRQFRVVELANPVMEANPIRVRISGGVKDPSTFNYILSELRDLLEEQ